MEAISLEKYILTIFNFFSTYFEVLFAAMIFLWLGLTVIILSIWLQHQSLKKVLNTFLYYLLLVSQTFLFVLCLSVFIINFTPTPRKSLDLSFRVSATTEWVKENLSIYFISGNTLVSIKANGQERQIIFEATEPIREYHFSPDGKQILVVTEKNLFQYNRWDRQKALIHSLNLPQGPAEEGTKGVINGIQWAPMSDKYCYRVSRWSKYSSQDQWYVYEAQTKKKVSIPSPSREMNSLFWDQGGENLYYPWFTALDASVDFNPYEVKVFRIPLATLTPEKVLQFPYSRPFLSPAELAFHGINIYLSKDQLSFGWTDPKRYLWESEKGPKIGLDNKDTLYYIRHSWWKRRLYRIPRVPPDSDIPRYAYKGGDLVIRDLRWLPGGRYVIMEHYFFGVLILEPATGKIGILVNDRGHTFGWYPEPHH